MRRPNSISKRLRSQSSERIVVVSGPIGSHCSDRRGALGVPAVLPELVATGLAALGVEAAPRATLERASGGLVSGWDHSHHQSLKAAAWPQGLPLESHRVQSRALQIWKRRPRLSIRSSTCKYRML